MIILGAASRVFPPKARVFLGPRPGQLEARESALVHVGMEVPREGDFAEKLAQGGFASNLNPPLTAIELWAARQPLS